MKGLSVGHCNSEVNQHVYINQHPKGQISTSATWPYILVAPWSGSMANLWYTPVSTNKIWPYTNSIPPLKFLALPHCYCCYCYQHPYLCMAKHFFCIHQYQLNKIKCSISPEMKRKIFSKVILKDL